MIPVYHLTGDERLVDFSVDYMEFLAENSLFSNSYRDMMGDLLYLSDHSVGVAYYCKLPADIEEREVIVLDPMLATGGSAIDAITQIKTRNPQKIKFMCIIAAPEGLEKLKAAHPDVDIIVASLDEVV